MKIMFVCHGNICRSPMAEFVFKDMLKKMGVVGVTVSSCATSREEIGNDIHPGTKRVLNKYNITFTKRAAYQLTKELYEEYDLIVAMDAENLWGLKRIVGDYSKEKVKLFMELAGEKRDIADPWYTGNFEETYRDVKKASEALISYIKNNF